MYERRRQPLLPRILFVLRFARSLALAIGIVLAALGIGVLGYHGFEGLSWLDALVNAAMILSGMGPVDHLQTPAGKLFAAVYALSSGFVFLTIAAVVFAPWLHRMIHRFHLENGANEPAE